LAAAVEELLLTEDQVELEAAEEALNLVHSITVKMALSIQAVVVEELMMGKLGQPLVEQVETEAQVSLHYATQNQLPQ
jgi:hypothetical protein